MRRGPKPAKAKGEAKRPVPRKSPKNNDARVRDLERHLAEARERERATGQILRVISNSPTDLQPVFDAIVQSAQRLLRAHTSSVFRRVEDEIHLAAYTRIAEAADAAFASLFPMSFDDYRKRFPSAELDWVDGTVIQIPDFDRDTRFPANSDLARARGFRSLLQVPIRHAGHVIGLLRVTRVEAGAFADDEIALLQTFADQAVIAIENVRLFSELEQKNRGLTAAHARITEALERQTATSEILRVISRSPTDVQPVFDAIVRSAVRLCNGSLGTVVRVDGERLDMVAHYNVSREGLQAYREHYPMPIGRETVAGNAILDRRIINVVDAQDDTTVPSRSVAMARAAGFRGVVAVPLLRDGEPIGLINVSRRDPGLFSDQHIALLKTFADQAVIAIENVRLFRELEARNRDLTATGEILRVISTSPTDVQPVFDTIVESARRLLSGHGSALTRVVGSMLHLAAFTSGTRSGEDATRAFYPIALNSDKSVHPRAVRTRAPVIVTDIETDPTFESDLREIARKRGYRSVMAVPLLREGEPIGTISVTRPEAGSFTDGDIALLRTFAAQAVIAIENVRLFTELQSSNRDLTAALEQQTATSEILRVIAGSPTDLQPVLDALVRSAGRLCEATDTFLLLVEGDQLRVAALHGAVGEGARISNTIQRGWVAGRAVVDARAVHVEDLANATAEFPLGAAIATRLGHRTALAIPLLRKGVPIGALFLRRREVRQFSDAERALLQTFADQAVIAIENVRLFKELEAANRELSAASQHKSEFLANMSHELRTPLNAVIGFSEVLSERMFGELNEKQEEYLRDIHVSGTHLLSLINDILDLSKIEAGRMELELTDFDLPSAINNALMLVRERAGRRTITLDTNIDNRLGQIHADERKIRQVVLNLLSNAIKFTPEGGRIDFDAVPKDGFVELSVRDTGVGIAPEDQEAVFEEFRQVGTADKKVEGTGLGLALSRKFIELHGGKIWVTSQLGQGSTFTFTIPAPRPSETR